MKNLKLFAFGIMVLLAACGKKNSTGGTTATPPTNLTVSATVSTDNSGNVSFTASATNANTYDYDFESLCCFIVGPCECARLH